MEQLPRLRALSLEANPLTDDSDFSASDFVKKLRAAFPELMLFNGEMVALAQLSQASHAATSTGKDSRQSATLRDEGHTHSAQLNSSTRFDGL